MADALTNPAETLSSFCQHAHAKTGEPITIRAICPADEPMMIPFHQALSDRTVRYRYFGDLKLGQRVLHERLLKVCHCDFEHDIALVAVHGEGDDQRIIAVGRIGRDDPHAKSMEFALLVRDDFQGKGVGKLLLTSLIELGRRVGLQRITADILPENREMIELARKVGFTLARDEEENVVRARIEL